MLVICIAITGCQDTVTGIFHHLAHQNPTVDGILPNNLTVGGVARWDDHYLISAGKLWSRPTTNTGNDDWLLVTSTFNGSTESAALSLVVRWQPAGETPVLLSGARFLDDTSFALLQADGDEVGATSIAWDRITDPAVDGREVIGLFTPNSDESVLFAIIADSRDEPRTYTLFSATTLSGTAPSLNTEIDDLTRPVIAITSDDNDTYWVISGGDLYSGTLGDLQKSNTAPSVSGSGAYGGVLHMAPNTLLLSSDDGNIWRSVDEGETWSEPYAPPQVNTQTVAFTGFAAVGSTVLIGTESLGYYIVTIETDNLAAERVPFTTEALYTASVHRFWIDPESPAENKTVFALTNGNGMLSNSVEPNEPPGSWRQE